MADAPRYPQIYSSIPEFKTENNTITEWLRLIEGPLRAYADTDAQLINLTSLKLGKFAHRVRVLTDDRTTWNGFKTFVITKGPLHLGDNL